MGGIKSDTHSPAGTGQGARGDAVAIPKQKEPGGGHKSQSAVSWGAQIPNREAQTHPGAPAPDPRSLATPQDLSSARSPPGQPHLGVHEEGQDEDGQQQVGDGEADDEVVGGGLERPLGADAEAHQPVASDDEEDEDDAQHQGGDVVAPRRGRRGLAAVPRGAAVPHGAAALPRQPGSWSRRLHRAARPRGDAGGGWGRPAEPAPNFARSGEEPPGGSPGTKRVTGRLSGRGRAARVPPPSARVPSLCPCPLPAGHPQPLGRLEGGWGRGKPPQLLPWLGCLAGGPLGEAPSPPGF